MSIKLISSSVIFAVSLLFPINHNQAFLGQTGFSRSGARTSEDKNLARYQKWLDEDVFYIITDDEKSAFEKLTTNRQRESFVINFWERRNPTPGSASNAFKEEHYRRLAYVNEHFASRIPGWKTHRGRIYILYGPPDERETHPAISGISLPRQAPDTRFPTDMWRYHQLAGVGQNLAFVFIDRCRCGNYVLVDDPSLKVHQKGTATPI